MILTLQNGMILTGSVDEIIEYINKTSTVTTQTGGTGDYYNKYTNKSFCVDYSHHNSNTCG